MLFSADPNNMDLLQGERTKILAWIGEGIEKNACKNFSGQHPIKAEI